MVKVRRKEVIAMQKLKKYKLTVAVVALLMGTLGGQAFAATSGTTTASVGIQSGGLTITAPTVTTAFGNITLTAGVVKPTATLSTLSVVDATGSGAGYKVTAQASQFTELGTDGAAWNGVGESGTAKTLPLSSLKLAVPSSITAVGGTTSPVPTASIAALTVIDGGAPVKVISAAVNQGLGSYNVAFPAASLELTVDVATAQVDTVNYPAAPTPYSSTITWSIVTGP